VNAHQRRRADGAGVEQLLRLQDRRVIEKVLGDPKRRPRARHGGGDAVGLGDRGRQRLLTGDVLAGRKRRHDLVGVHPGGREELDGVDRGIIQHLFEIRVHARRDAPLAGAPLGPLGLRVAQRDDVTPWVLQIAGRVELRDVPAADDGQTYAIHATGL
jgi:hypothetical protein